MVKKRAKVCFSCKQYIIIYSDNPMNLQFENVFSMVHSGHMVQIVNLEEVKNGNYMCVPESEEEIKKMIEKIQNDLTYTDGIGYSW